MRESELLGVGGMVDYGYLLFVNWVLELSIREGGGRLAKTEFVSCCWGGGHPGTI